MLTADGVGGKKKPKTYHRSLWIILHEIINPKFNFLIFLIAIGANYSYEMNNSEI